MNDSVCIICWLAEWALFLYKYLALRRAPREHKLLIWPVCAASWFTGTAFLFNSPTIGGGFDRLVRIPNVSMLLAYSCVVAMLCSMRIMLLLWRRPPARLWRTICWPVLTYGLIIVAIVVLFFVGSPVEEHHMDFAAAFGRTPYIAELLVIFFASVAYGLTDVAVLYWAWISTTAADQPWLRRGLRISAVAFMFPTAYGVINLVAIIGSWFGFVHGFLSTVFAPYVAGVGVPLAVIGLSIAAWGPRLAKVPARITQYWADLRDYRQLRPLWKALTPVDPAMIHQPGTWSERVSLESRLFWRVIEINDWLHQLRAYRDPAIARIVARRAGEGGLTEDDIVAAADAAQIVPAMNARANGKKVVSGSPQADQREVPRETQHAFGDERARLVLTARFLGSPLISSVDVS